MPFMRHHPRPARSISAAEQQQAEQADPADAADRHLDVMRSEPQQSCGRAQRPHNPPPRPTCGAVMKPNRVSVASTASAPATAAMAPRRRRRRHGPGGQSRGQKLRLLRGLPGRR